MKFKNCIAVALIFCLSAVWAEVNTYVGANGGDWFADANWSLGHAPTASEQAVITNLSVVAESASVNVGSLVLTNAATLAVGGSATRNASTLTVAGDLAVTEGSKLYVYAGTLTDADRNAAFATLETDIAPIASALWANAKLVTVGGDFIVTGAGSTVYPDADKVTGVPVIFKVAGGLTLGAGASFDAVERGWGWTEGTTTNSYAKVNTGGKTAWSLAPGSGCDYYIGGGYGGHTGFPRSSGGKKFGEAYGYAVAPFLPGSNSGRYTTTSDVTRGGGAVVVYAAGVAKIDGSVTVSSTYHDHSGASGGGIWLAASSFDFGADALLSAHGGYNTGYQGQGLGGGGRIALAEGYAWSEMETAATGVLPEGYVDAGAIYPFEVEADVAPGYYKNTELAQCYATAGSLSYVRKATAKFRVQVAIEGPGTVTYGGEEHNEAFELELTPGDEISVTATPGENGAFVEWTGDCLAGGYSETATVSSSRAAPYLLKACFASTTATTRTYTGEYNGEWDAAANWSPAGIPGPNDDAIVTGKKSVMVATRATMKVNSLTVKDQARVLIGATQYLFPNANAIVTAKCAATLVTKGDVTVRDHGRLYVQAGTLTDAERDAAYLWPETATSWTTLATNLWRKAKIVTIGGNLAVSNDVALASADIAASVYPYADPVTGVPVFFKVAGDLIVGEAAELNAVEAGWSWTSGTSTLSYAKPNTGGVTAWSLAPSAGQNYTRGSGYGGVAAQTLTASGHRYGYTYGYAVAPFLPGSCPGWHSTHRRGAGSIVVFTKGAAKIDGKLNADGACSYAAGCGGGIWLTAESITFGEKAALRAKGADDGSYGYTMGGGGRIALAEGYADADIEAAALTGEVPSGFRDDGAIEGVTVTVEAGQYTGGTTSYKAGDGTVSYVRSTAVPVNLHVDIVGPGTVTLGDTTYTESFDVSVKSDCDVTLTATPAEGYRVVSWAGAVVPGQATTESVVTIHPVTPETVVVTFANGVVTRTWQGGTAGNWEAPLNWLPGGVPTAADDVSLSSGTITSEGTIAVRNLTLSGTAVLKNQAVAYEGAGTLENVYAHPTVVTVTGAVRLEGSAALMPINDRVTGAAVRYDVGSLYVGEEATVDASGGGWFWYESAEDPYATLTQGAYQTRAIGAGGADISSDAYNRGGGYGAAGGNSDGKKYGKAYGNKYVPVLPGSPNGLYQFNLGYANYPGGTVWIKCAGIVELQGKIKSDGVYRSMFGASSGGGIWLLAKGLRVGTSASLSAIGCLLGNSGYISHGSGGRISLGLGLTAAQMDGLAAGSTPAELGLTASDEITLVTTSVLGSRRESMPVTYGNSGTVTTVIGPEAAVNVTVAGSPVQALVPSPAYGTDVYEKGLVQQFTAPEYGLDPNNANLRYPCTGYVVRASSGEVARGSGRAVNMTMENGPITLTWLWGAVEKTVRVRKPEHGTLTVDGVAVAGDVTDWSATMTASIGVVPDGGYEFVCWEGTMPLEALAGNPFKVAVDKPFDVTPVLRAGAEPTTRTWSGTGVWTDATKWTPAGNIPGPLDTVVIASGTCQVSNSFAVAALSVESGTLNVGTTGAGGAELRVTGAATFGAGSTVTVGCGTGSTGISGWADHARVAVGGDMTLSDTARVNVQGGVTTATYDFARGASFLEVGGSLTLADSSVLALYSDYLTGGSVKVTVGGTCTVGASAKVDAHAKGYMWIGATAPDAPGIGYSYCNGASHGGTGRLAICGSYDFDMAPIMPGSPNGRHTGSSMRAGGGVIRIHAHRLVVEGALDASSDNGLHGGASGGSIWLTANSFTFGADAFLSVRGGNSKTSESEYDSQGAGGRISIVKCIHPNQLAALAAGETCSGCRRKHVQSLAAFRAAYGNESMTVNLDQGTGARDPIASAQGTFVYIDATNRGLMLIMK